MDQERIGNPALANAVVKLLEGGVLEDPWAEPEEEMWRWTVSPEKAPDTPTYIELSYKMGDIVAIDGKSMSPAEVLTKLNQLAGDNGTDEEGNVDDKIVLLGHRHRDPVGIQVREVELDRVGWRVKP